MFVLVLSLFVIEAYLFLAVLIPFALHDQGHFWDSAGHIFAAWFHQKYLFPHVTGWNPFFFAGYPQDTFYGPTYHYLLSLLAFPLGLLGSFKFVTIMSMASLPFAMYYFARKLRFSPAESGILVFLMMLPISTLLIASGGTLYSQFYVGLGSESLALPFFFIYFGKLKEQIDLLKNGEIEQISFGNFLALTILLSFIILSHFVVAMAALIVAVVLISHAPTRKVFQLAIKLLLGSFLLCGFFLVPFLGYSGFTANPGTVLSMGFFLTIPIFILMMLGGAVANWEKDNRFDQTFFIMIAIFAIMAFMDFGPLMGMHAYRFVIFFMIFAMMLPVKLFINQLKNTPLKIAVLLACISLVAIHLVLAARPNPRIEINRNQLFFYKNVTPPYHPKIELGKLKGRILAVESRNVEAPHALRHLIARSSDNELLKGLFAESSIHARFIEAIHQNFLQIVYSGSNPSQQVSTLAQYQLLLQKYFRLYQINYLISEVPVGNAKLVQRVSVREDREPFYLYQLGDFELAELLPYQPQAISDRWSSTIDQWFASADLRILAQTKQLPSQVASPTDSVQIVKQSISPPLLKLRVNAKHDVPILIKISYFPRWQATSEGKRTEIYQVSPSFMLVYGKGDVELRYQSTPIDYLGGFLTFLGIAFVGWVGYREKFNRAV